MIANHASTRSTQLYDPRNDEVSLALQLRSRVISESLAHHDSWIMDDGWVGRGDAGAVGVVVAGREGADWAAVPAVAWQPETYRAFLKHLLAHVVRAPFATVTAGHGAGYLLAQAAEAPGSAGHLCLIAPTWRGPLPTMMNGKRPAFRWLARAVDVPL